MSKVPKDGSSTTTESWDTRRWDSKPTPEVMKRIREEDAARAAATLAPARATDVLEAAKTIELGDFLKVHQYPCHRQGYLTGIGGGAAVGALRYILGGTIPKAANWAVGVGVFASVVSFQVCQSLRRAEKIKMKRIVQVHEQKQAREQRLQAEEKRRKQEEADEAARVAAAQRRWYKFW